MKAVGARVTEAGRLSLPAEFRKVVGLEHGGDVVVELVGKEIRVRTVEEVVARAQELTRRLLAGKPGASVDAFLAERRREGAAKGSSRNGGAEADESIRQDIEIK